MPKSAVFHSPQTGAHAVLPIGKASAWLRSQSISIMASMCHIARSVVPFLLMHQQLQQTEAQTLQLPGPKQQLKEVYLIVSAKHSPVYQMRSESSNLANS